MSTSFFWPGAETPSVAVWINYRGLTREQRRHCNRADLGPTHSPKQTTRRLMRLDERSAPQRRPPKTTLLLRSPDRPA